MALSFVGVLWLVSRGEPLALRENGIAPGDRLALVNVVIYAAELWTRGFHLPPWQGWLLLAYVVLFVSILSKLFYMESVLVIGASRAALTMNLLPVFGALVGVAVFADERLGGYVLVALALVAAGIGLSEWGAMRLAFRRGA